MPVDNDIGTTTSRIRAWWYIFAFKAENVLEGVLEIFFSQRHP